MRPLALLGALLLSACSTDVFVGPDGAISDDGGGKSDGATSDGGGMPDAPTVQTEVQCVNGSCQDQVCCTGGTWDMASCAAAKTESTLSCQRYLECDDITDCTGGQVCCAQQFFDGTLAKNVITTARCSSTCAGSTSQVQLCDSNNECKAGTCQDYTGAPTWLKTCQ